jgi:hypothetical protein
MGNNNKLQLHNQFNSLKRHDYVLFAFILLLFFAYVLAKWSGVW